jgi:hypothetical protein
MEKLIAEINALGYSVSLRQYNKLKVNNEALWEACATWRDDTPQRNHATHIYMDEITFGRDAAHSLTKLLAKCATTQSAKPEVDEWGEVIEDEDVFD